MITNRRTNIATDPRGKIKTGIKARTAEGKEYPKGTEYFVITPTDSSEGFPELVAVYGEKPTKLLVMPPADSIESVFDDSFVLYGGRVAGNKQGTKIRSCDGSRCVHRIAESFPFMSESGIKANASFAQGEETDCICQSLGLFDSPDKDTRKKACRYVMHAKFFVGHPQTGKVISPMPIHFESGSRNTGSAIHDALENMAAMTAMFAGGMPMLQYQRFELEVHMVEGKKDAKQKFPIWRMSPIGTMMEIQTRLGQIAQIMGRDEVVKRLRESAEKAISDGKLLNPAQAPTPLPPSIEEDEEDGDGPAEGLFDGAGKIDKDNPLGAP